MNLQNYLGKSNCNAEYKRHNAELRYDVCVADRQFASPLKGETGKDLRI